MYRRLNITLPDDVVARADAFAERERYTRSALIAAALDAFMGGEVPAVAVAPEEVGLNPAVRPLLPEIIDACRRHEVTYAAIVGPSARSDSAITPRRLDLLVRFGPEAQHIKYRHMLQTELEILTDLTVDLIEIDTLGAERRRTVLELPTVVLYESGPTDA